MRVSLLLPLALAAGVVNSSQAQVRARTRVLPVPGRAGTLSLLTAEDPRAVIGITTSSSGSSRDTLGVLVQSVTPGGPAERAGIEEGSRIASINGVSLRLAAADVDDPDMSSIMTRRLTRELGKVKPGDEVELRVYNNGQTRTVRVKTVSSEELYAARTRRIRDDRPTLGFGLGSSGSRRDTLGVLVMYVNDSGPAAKAGMEEGNRIASINGVDLRVSPADAGDDYVSNAKARRLQREIGDLKPGDEAELRVYQNGSYRTIRLRAVRASDLPGRKWGFIFGNGPMMTIPPVPRTPDEDFDGTLIGDEVRRAIERAMEAAGSSLEGVGRALDGVGRGLGRTRIQWNDGDVPSPSRSRTPAPPRRTYRTADVPDAGVKARVAASNDALVASAVPAVALGGEGSTFMYAGDQATMSFSGLELSLVDHELAGYLGEGSEAGLLVTAVPRWADGLRTGDVILKIDGKAVRAGDEATLEFGDARTAAIDILRRGERTRVTVTLPR